MYNYNKLKGRIKEVFGTQEEFAKSIGRSKTFVSLAMNGKTVLSQDDISNACDSLGIPVRDIGLYFFTKKVHDYETLNEQTEQ